MRAKKWCAGAAALCVCLVLGDSAPAAVRQASGPYKPESEKDTPAAITATVRRYAQSWYEGNTEAMQQTLHPDFSWHLVSVSASKPSSIAQRSGLGQLDVTDRGLGRGVVPSARKADVTVLAVDRNLASVRLLLTDRTELLHLTRWNNRWLVIDALSEAGAAP